jgi:hypothetical protein
MPCCAPSNSSLTAVGRYTPRFRLGWTPTAWWRIRYEVRLDEVRLEPCRLRHTIGVAHETKQPLPAVTGNGRESCRVMCGSLELT